MASNPEVRFDLKRSGDGATSQVPSIDVLPHARVRLNAVKHA
jgi:hypothetical protein